MAYFEETLCSSLFFVDTYFVSPLSASVISGQLDVNDKFCFG